MCSRGANTQELLSSPTWWSGRSWLTSTKSTQPRVFYRTIDGDPLRLVDMRKVTISVSVAVGSSFSLWDNKFSSLSKLLQVMAWIHRFIDRFDHKLPEQTRHRIGSLGAEEIRLAKVWWIQWAQQEHVHVHQRNQQKINTRENSEDAVSPVRL